jgi:hypothetical protein
MNRRTFRNLLDAHALLFACAMLLTGCAASRRVDPSKPRAEAPYPVVLAPSEERSRAAERGWEHLLAEQGITTSAPAPTFHPTTATLSALPASLSAPLRLPQVGGGDGKEPTDEETRESLRRFLERVDVVLGVQSSQLSLVEFEKTEGTLTRAVYQQNPFEFPLRGNYGRVEVSFDNERRVVSLSSTAIPEIERLRRAFAGVQQDRLSAEKALAAINGRAITYTDAAGNTQTRTVAAQGETSVRELVVYPLPSKADPLVLQLHVAWEVAVGGGTPLYVYVDAVSGEVIAVAPNV